MKTSRRGDKNLLRAINRNLVLTLIHGKGPLSRTDIVRQSGLGNATVSEITSELVASGLVEEVGEGRSTGGRRPQLLRLNAQHGYVVGIKVMEHMLTCAVTDLHANVVAHSMYPLGDVQSPATLLERLRVAVHTTAQTSSISLQRVLGIGIGIAGIVDGHSGVLRYSPYFKWSDVELARPIADHFGLPVYLENDVNTLTIAEQWFGYGRGLDNFVVVTIGRGIGSGIVMNGQFCRDAVGEIGHMTMLINGPRCDCGKQGCLEAIAADPAVLRRLSEELARGRSSVLSSHIAASLEAVVDAAQSGDVLAIEVLSQSGYFLGVGIANLINLLSPQAVIISGEGVRAGEFRIGPMRKALSEHIFNGLDGHVNIITAQTEDETWARGAASLVLGEMFKSPILGGSEIISRLL